MSDNAPRAEELAGDPSDRRDPFSIEAYLERQEAEFAEGPSMAEILADMDRFRADGPAREDIVSALRDARREREDRWDAVWHG